MPDRSQFEVIKHEVRAATAYTLEHFAADVKLDQNENPYELPNELKREVVDRVLGKAWGRYPDFVPDRVLETLETFTGWSRDGILVGNGSNELINATLLVTLQPGSTIAIPQPTFTLYKLMANTLGATVEDVFLNTTDMSFDIGALINTAQRSDMLILCSPNNPTGTLLGLSEAERIIGSARGLVILDEAYHEFSGQTMLPLLERHENLILLRTFSKAMSMAGLRFGYMLTHPRIAREIEKAKLPYSVNVFTLAAAEVVMENPEVLLDTVRKLIDERGRLARELEGRSQVETFSSWANFILIRTAQPAGLLFDALYSDGVLVRDVSHYPLLDRALRVSVGTQNENTRFLSALDRALETLE